MTEGQSPGLDYHASLSGLEQRYNGLSQRVAHMDDRLGQQGNQLTALVTGMDSIKAEMSRWNEQRDRPFPLWQAVSGVVAIVVALVAGGATYLEMRVTPFEIDVMREFSEAAQSYQRQSNSFDTQLDEIEKEYATLKHDVERNLRQQFELRGRFDTQLGNLSDQLEHMDERFHSMDSRVRKEENLSATSAEDRLNLRNFVQTIDRYGTRQLKGTLQVISESLEDNGRALRNTAKETKGD